jgi:hypothetical protein
MMSDELNTNKETIRQIIGRLLKRISQFRTEDSWFFLHGDAPLSIPHWQ